MLILVLILMLMIIPILILIPLLLLILILILELGDPPTALAKGSAALQASAVESESAGYGLARRLRVSEPYLGELWQFPAQKPGTSTSANTSTGTGSCTGIGTGTGTSTSNIVEYNMLAKVFPTSKMV